MTEYPLRTAMQPCSARMYAVCVSLRVTGAHEHESITAATNAPYSRYLCACSRPHDASVTVRSCPPPAPRCRNLSHSADNETSRRVAARVWGGAARAPLPLPPPARGPPAGRTPGDWHYPPTPPQPGRPPGAADAGRAEVITPGLRSALYARSDEPAS